MQTLIDDILPDLLEPLDAACNQDELPAIGCQMAYKRLADPAGCTRDQSCLSWFRHGCILSGQRSSV
jgi:hypothetical protein